MHPRLHSAYRTRASQGLLPASARIHHIQCRNRINTPNISSRHSSSFHYPVHNSSVIPRFRVLRQSKSGKSSGPFPGISINRHPRDEIIRTSPPICSIFIHTHGFFPNILRIAGFFRSTSSTSRQCRRPCIRICTSSGSALAASSIFSIATAVSSRRCAAKTRMQPTASPLHRT